MNCQYCGNKFNSIKSLKHHQKLAKYCLKLRGEKEYNFECSGCKKTYTCRKNLELHERKCNVLHSKNQQEKHNKEINMYKQELKDMEDELIYYKTHTMLLPRLPKDLIGLCMTCFTLSELILFANTCRYLKKLSATAPFKELDIKIYQDDLINLDWILSYVGRFPLNKLTLRGTAFSNPGLAFIKTPLKVLSLDTPRITCNALQLIDCSALEEVYLSNCDITIDALSQLNEAIIHTLSFVGCVLEEGVLRFLQNFKHLRCLNLSLMPLSRLRDDIKHLNTNLKKLYLRDTFITYKAVEAISGLSLDYLDIRNSFITLSREKKLKKNIPNCIFDFPVRKNNVIVRRDVTER